MQEDQINLGIVMAGAVSAGAYTAGVVDFLTEAMDVWESNKKINNGPKHHVNLKVITGASAGGMTAGILAKMLYKNFEHFHHKNNFTPNNDLYKAWVEEVSFQELLGTDDIDNGSVKAILNGNMVKRIAENLIVKDDHFNKKHKKIRDYVDENLEVYYTLANLKGIPYDVTFQGNSSKVHRIFTYSDHIHFKINKHGNLEYGKNSNFSNKEIVQLYASSAIATGAFPVGLPAVNLNRSAFDYSNRYHQIPNDKGCLTKVTISPDWNESDLQRFDFVAVDGGTFNNEPFNLAFQQLQNDAENQKAIIMVDPFPNDTAFDVSKSMQTDLLPVLGNLLKSLLGQARFRIEDLYKAFNENNNDRFLIAPRRSDSYTAFPIACGYLDGFSGFLDKRFRRHDYQLGRRNCQRFLTHYFRLPVDNILFKNWDEETKKEYLIKDQGKEYLPIIPVMAGLQEEITQPSYPIYTEKEVSSFTKHIENRIDAIFKSFAGKINGWLLKSTVKLLFRFVKKRISKALIKSMNENLKGGNSAHLNQGLIRSQELENR
jgi:hypothetical protein